MSRRRDYEGFYGPGRPIETDEGIKARSRTGKIGQSWWAGRWIDALEELVDAGRLRRGRSYARSGQVLSLVEKTSGITARVQGSRPRPYTVKIALRHLSNAQWEAVIGQMAGQAIFAAQLLAGEMPPDIEQAFAAAGVSLFPQQEGDLVTSCTCPDLANPCKHIAATHYILGEQFDEDPFMIFRLRGRSQTQILAALRALRSEQPGVDDSPGLAESGAGYGPSAGAAEAPPLAELLAAFWQAGAPLETLAAPVKQLAISMPLLRRLGQPAFMPDEDLAGLLAPAYDAITQAALLTAYGEPAAEDPDTPPLAAGTITEE